MGFWSEFDIFCRNWDLDPNHPDAWHYYTTKTVPELEECANCKRRRYRGFCYYCGDGQRPQKSEAQRQHDESRAVEIWNEAAPIEGTLAEYYLRHHRKIAALPHGIDAALRWHPNCPFDYQLKLPCMVGLLRDAESDRPRGIHRTAIDYNRGKLQPQAKVFGTYDRCAVKLWPAPVNGKLSIGEGIETVLSAIELMPDLAPAWAVGTANNIGGFPILDVVAELHILADNDPKERGRTGQKKAAQLAGKYSAFAKRVETHTPKRHKDFNDILRELKS
jgi:hypothetical protein